MIFICLPHPGLMQTVYLPLPSPYLYHSFGGPTTPATKRSYHNLVILQFRSTYTHTKSKKYKNDKTKAKIHVLQIQTVSSLHSVPFPCPMPLLQLRWSSEIRLPPQFHTHPFSQKFVLAQIWTFYIKWPTFSMHVTYGLSTISQLSNSSQACS